MRGIFEHGGHAGGDGVGPGVAVATGAVTDDVAEIPDEGRIRRHGQRHFAEGLVGKRQEVIRVGGVNLHVQREIGYAEGKLAAVIGRLRQFRRQTPQLPVL